MINYRRLTELDIDELLLLENECFKDPFKREDLLYELKDNPVNVMIGAFDSGNLVGFIDYMITFNSSTIVQIAVTSSYRKNGIAQDLLRRMEQSFPKDIDDVVETITLEVREGNTPARNLYKKDGYEEVVLKKNYYRNGENAVYMVKRLFYWQQY